MALRQMEVNNFFLTNCPPNLRWNYQRLRELISCRVAAQHFSMTFPERTATLSRRAPSRPPDRFHRSGRERHRRRHARGRIQRVVPNGPPRGHQSHRDRPALERPGRLGRSISPTITARSSASSLPSVTKRSFTLAPWTTKCSWAWAPSSSTARKSARVRSSAPARSSPAERKSLRGLWFSVLRQRSSARFSLDEQAGIKVWAEKYVALSRVYLERHDS